MQVRFLLLQKIIMKIKVISDLKGKEAGAQIGTNRCY